LGIRDVKFGNAFTIPIPDSTAADPGWRRSMRTAYFTSCHSDTSIDSLPGQRIPQGLEEHLRSFDDAGDRYMLGIAVHRRSRVG
jgi:hypothetical protein